MLVKFHVQTRFLSTDKVNLWTALDVQVHPGFKPDGCPGVPWTVTFQRNLHNFHMLPYKLLNSLDAQFSSPGLKPVFI